jgi:hypothetical protein
VLPHTASPDAWILCPESAVSTRSPSRWAPVVLVVATLLGALYERPLADRFRASGRNARIAFKRDSKTAMEAF